MPGIGIGIGFHRPLPPMVKFSLLENGLDFITEAIQSINAKSNHKRLKYSIIHLCAGMELIFKEVLIKKDWQLIFYEPSKASELLLQTGDFVSATFNQAIDRLVSNCHVKINQDDKKALLDLRMKRNRIEHFIIDESVNAIKSLCSNVLNFLITFIDQNIDLNKVSTTSKTFIDNLRKELPKFSAFVTERNQRINSKIEHKIAKGLTIIKCPRCFQKALLVDEDLKCLFCYFTSSPETIAIEYNKEFGNNNGISKNCGICNAPTIIDTEDKRVCLSCKSILVKVDSSQVKPI